MPPTLFRLGTLVALTVASVVSAATPAPRLAAPLPDPLVAPDGRRITTAEQWTKEQRPRVLELFRAQVYGRMPVGRPDSLKFAVHDESASTFSGKARRKLVRVSYSGPGGESGFDATLYLPKATPAKGVFILIENRPREIIDDAEAKPTEFWPVEAIVDRGYATVAFFNGDLALDNKDRSFDSGVFKVFGPTPRTPDSWGALAAWGWGASRVIDYLETDPDLKGKPVAVLGHSRGGKAALWCGAQDPRVALTISNDSGNSGAALARRTHGETIEVISRVFPHWFALNYRAYADKEETLPLDQHWLVALMAPRLVYVAAAHDDAWADTAAQFGAGVAAAPVFKLFGLDGVGAPDLPADNSPRHAGAIGFHVRPGGHNLLLVDWKFYMDFADRHWSAPKR